MLYVDCASIALLLLPSAGSSLMYSLCGQNVIQRMRALGDQARGEIAREEEEDRVLEDGGVAGMKW